MFLMFFLSVLCPDVTVTSDGAWSSYLSLYRERQGEKWVQSYFPEH